MNNEQVLLAKYPEGMPQDDTFKYENIDIVDPKENEIQIESLYISVDPYMLGRMTQAILMWSLLKLANLFKVTL